jgi:metallophosphoesterase (TIGR00282 family)
MEMKILCLGEITGKGGIHCIKKGLPLLKEEKKIDLVIANAEGATNGFGLGKNHSVYLHKLGLDILFLGEKGFFKRDMVEFAAKSSFILRPVNFPSDTPGRGWKIVEINDKKLAIISAMGLSGFNRVHLNNPYTYLPSLVEKLKEKADFVVVEFHSATSAEKKTLFHLLKGKVSIISGSHTKALTADNAIMDGTGVISDTGRCGSIQSVGGFLPSFEIKKIMTGMPIRSQETMESLELQGALFTLNENGECIHTELIRQPVESPPVKENAQ